MTVTDSGYGRFDIKYHMKHGTQKVNTLLETQYFHTYCWERLSNYQLLLLTNVQL